MLMNTTVRLCLSALLIAACCTSAHARTTNPGEAAFKEKFGKEMREVRRTKPTDDDAAFAKKMFTEATSGTHDADLTLVLYDTAYEYGLRDPIGYPTADQALDKLLELDESKAFEICEMRLALFEKWHTAQPNRKTPDYESLIDRCMQLSRESFEAGDSASAVKLLNRASRFAMIIKSPRLDDVRDSMKDLIQLRKVLDEIDALEKTMGTDEAAADKLAMIYLKQMDDPAEALTYANQMFDQDLADKVRLAAKEFEFATPEEANQAGLFYFELSDDNQLRDPVAMLIRSRVWLTEFLSRDHLDAEENDKAQALQQAKETLAKIDSALLKEGVGKKLRRKMSSLLRGEGQFDRPAEVQAAIDKAVEWLYSIHKDENHWEVNPKNHRNWGGYTALVVYALLMADEEPKLNGDLSRAINFMMNTDMKGTYALCFRIHAWEVMPNRDRYRQNLVKDVQRLRGGASKHGYWGYTMTGHDVQPGTRVDTSTTLAGGLGLWIGEEVGRISTNKIYWERLAKGLLKNQLEDNGWSYNPYAQKSAQGAMTAGVLALLHASRPHLDEELQAQVDEAIGEGMEWMDANFSATTNVNRGIGRRCYYFAAVQHAGLFAGRSDFKQMNWYESISDHLVKSQAQNGSWGTVDETAFAVAFLCRGGVEYEPSGSENAEEPEAEAASPDSEAAPAE